VGASYFFYGMANPWYCLLLLTSTLVDYIIAPLIFEASGKRKKRLLLLLSIATNLGLLGVFKYGEFTVENINQLFAWGGLGSLPVPEFLLPVGISFYTFQTLSYTIDVYRGTTRPTNDFAAFALYVAYFPQLVAGPIERSGSLLPQFLARPRVSREDLVFGFQRVLYGLFKKVVVADRLAIMVDRVYAAPDEASAAELVLATIAFSFQLYIDFSAYSDIAIGTARMMGVRLRENFNWPYLARNPSEFWSRWHMSLTTWFRDYVYSPLARVIPSQTARVVLLPVFVMGLVGLWHGAGWNFIVFGLLAGAGIASYQLLRRITGRRKGGLLGSYWWSTPLAISLNFLHVSFMLIVLFRSPDLTTAWSVTSGIFVKDWTLDSQYEPFLLLVVAVAIAHVLRGLFLADRKDRAMPAWVQGAFWYGMFAAIVFAGVSHSERFIYFQF
jgi:D-alanyl-lipoteichoic acid acyltransferase DltB (MBOAT superfamily)